MSTQRDPIQFFPPVAGRPFSESVRVGDVLYLSGQLGVREDGTISPDFAEQARQTMENIRASLSTAGAGLGDVFKCTVMLADMSRWQEFNDIYLEYFPADRLPTRSAFGTSGLAYNAHMEVECWAYSPATDDR